MEPPALLAVYCLVILLSSLAGGWVPNVIRLTHRRMELALSFVSGVMLGVGLLHLVPHALVERAAAVAQRHDHDAVAEHAHDHGAIALDALDASVAHPVAYWLLGGFLAMFMLERFFCFHHHDAPGADGAAPACSHGHDHGPGASKHRLSWAGAAIGLTVHSLLAGVALAAAVLSGAGHGHAHGAVAGPAGFGAFLVIVLHKPFDALTIGTLMAAGGHHAWRLNLVNALFALVVPVGAAVYLVGLRSTGGPGHDLQAAALAFSAGTFLCISLSDLLPELQFHAHDRGKLTAALVLGLAVAAAVAMFE